MTRKQKTKNIEWLKTPKGTKDILCGDFELYKEVIEKAESIAAYYGFKPIATPHIEKEDLFTATLGETSDVIEKQMFSIKTRGGDRLVLRPEGTAGIMRAYFEHGMHTLPQPVMLYYQGSFFRHEKPQRGRYRELKQFGLEILGSSEEITDVIIIRLISVLLQEFGIPYTVNINTLGDRACAPLYKKDLVSFFKKRANYLCKDCKRRLKTNPLRILDCKEERCYATREDAPQMINYLCDECKKHFKNVIEYLDALGIPYILDNFLVRGLDYYSRTVFEFFEETEQNAEEIFSKIAVASGGRYDYLGETLGNRSVPSVGGAVGLDRIVLSLKEKDVKPQRARDKKTKIFLIQLGDLAKQKSLNLIEDLRKARIETHYLQSKDNLRNQLKIASNTKAAITLIIGQKEALENQIIVKNMDKGVQELVSADKIIDYLKNKI